ncbi:non-ribosomal peptide synthetase [Streptomyces sp. NBC_01294]|uniref:non-ribosomal peptide synthetase n=1 Tax=Streptomyces sp. NBC_01294 TaxID=2903815 RepID=UPI002DD81083|nr:non-ribosomal peptide synthetase [Streptomyces sp. NBC_01294]WRZ62228.1 amino acid adenylation domain-containing protein [Streptomyces sp. NBC_01294]
MSEKKTTTTLTVPRLGEGIVEVLILRLLKQPGDLVAKDELLYEMEHDKASLEIESPTAGRLTAWLVEEGRRVPIGGAVAEIEPVAETGAPAEPGAAADGAGPAPAPAQGASPAGPPGQPRTGTVRIPPRTRAHARRLGLDETVLATLVPARGRSLMPADLERHVADRACAAPEPQQVRPQDRSQDPVEAAKPVAAAPLTGAGHDFTDLPVSRRQKELNRALRSGTGDVVPAVVATEVREELLASALRARRAAGDGQSFTTAFQVFAHLAARVAADFPFLRSRRLGEDHLRVFEHVDLGIACAGEDGDLTIGVVRGSDLLDADRFDERYADAVERALGGESQADGRVTLMLSHLGDQGATFAVPVVVPPAAATLFLGAPSGSGPKAVRRIVLAFDHTVFNGQEAARFLDALRAELAQAGEPEAPVPAATTDRTRVDGQQAREVRESALERLTALASEVADHAVNPDRPLGEQGIDSAKALRLTREAGRIFGTKLPATAIWKYPTLRALAELLPQTAPGETPPTLPTPSAPVASAPVASAAAMSVPVPVAVPGAHGPAEDDVRGAVAVIGMACRVPGADDVDAFWSLLAEGHCRIEPVPAGRFAGSPAGDPATAPRAGLLDRIDLFDARFFSVTPRQAASMDPQQRALLELSWHALEHAALDPDDLAGTPVGVFAAACSYDYREQLVERDAADGYATVGTFPAFLANRISHTYDFTGPSITVDTACSGALTALSLAERAILSGDCEIALAGAANLLSNGFNNEAYRRAGMLSPQGTSLVFDRGADGFVRGEGAGWVVLKRLDRAIEDGDPVLAVLRATAVNHGGRAAALTAPNPRAQAALVRTALDRAGLHAEDLGFLEAHGTATPLGDPIEIDAVREVLEGGAGGPVTRAAGPLDRLWVGSAKANIGHLEGASGLAGLIKAVHVLRNELIPGTPNFTELNPHIDLEGTPLTVADRPVRWPRVDGSPRRAAVSAFGFGGSNAHAVLEEAPALDGPGAANGNGVPLAVPLSAATARSLARLAGRLADRIGREPSDLDLQQIAWSLQSGRRALAERMLVVTRDTGELADAAKAFAAGETHPAIATLGCPDALAALADDRARTALLEWLSSGTADWAALWTGGQPPRRVPLVPYPFEREPYWLPGEPAARPASTAVVATAAAVTGGRTDALVLPAGHPLAEHRVAGRAVAPGALLIDALAGGGPVALRGVRFLRPVPFGDGLRLERGTDDGHGRTALTVTHDGHVHARAVADPGTPEPLAAGDRTLADGTPVDLAGVLHRAGIHVGTAYHAVTALVRSGSRAAGLLTPPAGDPLTRRVGWLDAALQAACALTAPGSTLMAGAIGRVSWSGELPDRADLLLHLVEDSPGHLLVDLDAVTEDGRAVLRVRGLRLVQAPAAPASAAPASTAPAQAAQDSAPIRVLSPVWAEESTPRPAPADTATHTVALYDRHTERAADGLRGGVATLLPVGPDGVDRDRLGTAVRAAAGSPLAVTLLVGGCRWTEDTAGVTALRHWLTALLTTAQVLAESGTPAEVRLLTTGLGAPDGESPAAGASLQGALLGALRTLPLEVPAVTAAAVDLPADALHRAAVELIAAAVAEPCGRAVPLVALRGARRLRQVLAERPLPDAQGFRTGGVYVVFGGAGGIGGEVARHLAARYRASLLLVGRSAEGEDVRNLLDDLRAAGGQAHYHRGDVTDAGDVAAALARCRTAFGEPDGLLHSVGSVSDGLLTGLTATDIDHVLETKVTAVLTLRRALAGRPGTALVLFSSVAGLFGSVGGLNYAAANAFLDHYAAAVDGDGGLVVRTFDWGLWRGTGLARQYTAHVRRQYPGLTDFEPERGVAALEAGMSGTDPQTVAISGDPEPLRALTRPAAADPAHLLERYARGALARTMADLGLDHGTAQAGCTAAADLLGVVPEHHRLLAAVLDLLEGEGPDAPSAAHLAADRAALLAGHPDLLGHVELLDRALASYGPVLRGEQPATAVLFPRGDLGAVSAIYSDNQLFDPVNAAVARELAADAARIAREGRRPRVLEIGAGVGGTTASALAAMDALGVTDAEYAYTDVSRAFLQHARRRFGERVSPQLLDIEKSPAGQGFATGHYDLVVASNVLHATRDLTLVLRHVSELLAPGGRLLLVEITVPAAVYTLTFGLTDGWWRYVDTQYRLPHGPLLDGARWQALLEAGGWTLAGIGHLRDVPGCVALLDCRAPSAPAADVPAADGTDGTRDRLREIVRELLGDPRADIPGDRPWQELGIDSLLNLELVTAVSKAFGEISSTALFEHRTLDELARALGGQARPAGATAPATAFAPAEAPAAGNGDATGDGAGAADLLAELTGLAADVTGQDHALIDQDSDFPSIGVDSLLNGEFTAALRQRFPARAIPSTVLFEHTSLRSLAAWLAAPTRQARPHTVTGAAATPPAPVTVPATSAVSPNAAARSGADLRPARRAVPAAPSGHRAPVAIVGLAGRYPGAEDIDAFWRLLSEGRTPVTEVPAERWDWRTARTLGGGYARWGCFLDGWDRFDPELFRITPRDAAVMDPQERLFLEVSWEAFETAGYSRRTLSGSAGGPKVGVFAGVTSNSHLIAQHQARLAGADNPEYAVTAAASVANRVSHAFDLSGPSLTVDTMCSSSLTALHLACRAVQDGEADLALAGGVNLYLHPDRFAGLCALGMPSRGDRTRAFGAGGDGFVPGEGVGAVVLKRLDRAEADGDTVYAVIRGTGLNHGGGTGGYTVPNPLAQAAVIGTTLDAAGIDPAAVGYLEAHGTGTELGDPIELRALALAFDGDRPATANLRIGSVKSNIGHGEAAAGIAGLTKAVLQLRHGQLVPTLHAEQLNPKLDLDGTSLHIQRRAEAWPQPADAEGRPLPRLAAVSSFGAGGTNAHVLLEEYPQTAQPAPARFEANRTPVVLPLSAPDPERLRTLAARLAGLIAHAPGSETLLAATATPTDIAHTLRVGRETWPHRAAVTASDPRRLREALTALAESRPHPDVATADTADHAEADARAWVVEGRLPAQDLPGRRVALPTTPFTRRRCTLTAPEGHDPRLGAPIDLPLADSVRIPASRTVTARLGGASRWVADHVVDGTALLPGAFHPELVHEALLTAGESPYRQVIRDLMWPAPAAGLPMTVRAELAEPDADGARSFTVEAVTAADGERTAARGWTEAAVADRVQPSLRYRPEDLARHLAEGVDAEDFYQVFAAHGFAYGPLYRTVRRALRDGEETTARLRLPDGEDRDGRQVLHPALFDGACQTAAFLLLCEDPAARRRYRPLSVNRLAVHAPVTGEAYVHARRVRAEEASGTHVFDVRLVDAGSGEVLAEAEGFRIRVEDRDAPAAPARTADTATAAAFAPADGDRAPAVATYRLGWPDAPRPAAGRPIGTLWTVGDGALADGLAPQAAARLSFDRACDVAALEETAGRTGAPATVLVDLTGGLRGLGFGADPLPAGQIAADWTDFRTGPIAQVFGLLRALVCSRALDGVLVLFVTDDSATGPSPFQRALHSLVRTVAGETGRLRLRMASVAAGTAGTVLPDAVAAVRAELSAEPADGEDWVRIGPGDRRRRAALAPVRDTGTADPAGLLRADGTYLVIGGQGGLGSEIAAAVRAARPTARLVLVGRSAPDEAALAELRGPAGTGPVDYRRCDVTDLAQLAELAAELQRSGTELHGIVHTAGVLRDGFLRGKTPEVIEEVCRAKVLAAIAVDAAFHDHPLDFFVVASSLAALVGNQGQSDYAFANGFLDGFAAARTRWTELGLRSGRSLSVGWPVLEGAGMAPEPAALGYLSDTFGLRPLPVREAVRRMWPLLDLATGPGQAHAALVAGDQDMWSRALGVVADGTADTPEVPAAAADADAAVDRSPAAPADGRPAALRWLAERVSRAIGVPAAMIAADRPMLDYGVDSIAVMRLSRLLEDDLGRLPVALFLDSSTLGELTDRLLRDHGAQLTAAVAAEPAPAAREAAEARTVASATATAPTPAAEAVPADGAGRAAAVPLPDRLIGMWTSDQAAAPLAPYNVSLSWQSAGVDRAALAAAVDDLVRRHPVLGCCVRPHRGEPSFVPAQTAAALVDRSPEAGMDLAAAVRQEADRRFALATEPLLRAVLWRDGTDTVVQLTTHHLAADGRSAELIGRDLTALYAARTGGGPALAPAPSFADVLRREREDAARTRAADESFWAGRLAGPTAEPLFPDTGAGAASAQREYGLGADLSKLLLGTARTAGVTPFTVLLAAFAASLGRLTGRRSFLLAVPAYGRASASEDEAVGCFVNSVPLRIDLDPARPVADWLAVLHDEVRGAIGHAGLPYPRLAELCRAAGEHTVPTVTVAYQNWRRETDGSAPAAGHTEIGLPFHRRGQRGHFDLGFEVTDGPDGVEVLANHRTDALDGTAVDGLVEDLRRMVVELARDTDGGRVGQLLDPAGSTLVSRFADSVRRSPDRPAVEDRDGTLSYAALDELSDAVARQVSRAVGPGEPVAVLMHRSARLAAVLLGILKSGRPYVPLDDSYPADRLRMVVEGAECRLAVADPDLAALLPPTLRVLPAAEALDPDAAPQPGSGQGTAPLPGDLAYLMFTSGSTGRPKGVGVTHGNVVHTLEAIAATTGTGPQDRLLAVTTVCFDISVLELFMPLLTGGTVVVARRTDVVDAGRLAGLIESRDVTVLQATPAGWQLLLDGGWRGRAGLTALCGGEALPPNLAAELVSRTGSLWNVYGPTEATIWSTIGRVDGATVHLGGPIGATGLTVTEVDGTAAPAPGEPGELWIGGPAVAQGYWHRPDLTAERFTAHPARPEGGGRWFRTGDLVRRDEQGRLVFLGRADSQVKIRGHRVELGEIEAVLGTHPGLARVVVVLRGTGALVRLVAVAVPARGAAAPGLDELRAFAAASLPAWMLPDRLVTTPELALTPNGKVDRKAAALLAQPAAEREAATDPVRSADPAPAPVPMPPAAHAPAQADPAEIRQGVTSFWAELLELDRVPGDRRFFDLGGNSLLLGRLFARLEDRFPDTGLEVADLFARPTLDDQVALLTERLAPVVPAVSAVPAESAGRTALPAPAARPSRREARRALRLGDDHR